MRVCYNHPKVTHNQGNFQFPFLVKVGTSQKPGEFSGICYSYIIFACDGSEVIGLFKENIINWKAALEKKNAEGEKFYLLSDIKRAGEMLEWIDKEWYNVSEIDRNRAIKVSYFDN